MRRQEGADVHARAQETASSVSATLDWMGSMFKDTYKPFLAILLVSFAAAWVIHLVAPDVTKISDLLTR